MANWLARRTIKKLMKAFRPEHNCQIDYFGFRQGFVITSHQNQLTEKQINQIKKLRLSITEIKFNVSDNPPKTLTVIKLKRVITFYDGIIIYFAVQFFITVFQQL